MMVDDGTAGGSPKVSVALSREDEAAIRALAEELRMPAEVVAETYGREIASLRQKARVLTFLPLVVSRRVRRLQVDARGAH